MRLASRPWLAILGAALVFSAIPALAATQHHKKAAKVRPHALKLTLTATAGKGTLSGKPFGKGKVSIETDPPQYYFMTWKFPHGSILVLVWLPGDAKGSPLTGATCHFIIGGGTGRYAKITGSGTMTGTSDGRTWHVVASKTVKY